jgi:hypothetical protein
MLRINTILAQNLPWDDSCVIGDFQKSRRIEGRKKVGNNLVDFKELLDILGRLRNSGVKLKSKHDGGNPEHLGSRRMHDSLDCLLAERPKATPLFIHELLAAHLRVDLDCGMKHKISGYQNEHFVFSELRKVMLGC